MGRRKPRVWTCQKVTGGERCRHRNPARNTICAACGKKRGALSRPKHMAALDTMTYEQAVALFGERCGICGAAPKPGKKLQRDHEHKGDGFIRGLLCFRCNILLKDEHTLDWMRRAVAYLERAERRRR